MRDNGDLRVEVGLFRELLRVTGTSFREIGEHIGVSHTTVARWASGESNASVAQMQAVLEVLASEPKELERQAAVLSHLVGALGRDLEDYRSLTERLVGTTAGGYGDGDA